MRRARNVPFGWWKMIASTTPASVRENSTRNPLKASMVKVRP